MIAIVLLSIPSEDEWLSPSLLPATGMISSSASEHWGRQVWVDAMQHWIHVVHHPFVLSIQLSFYPLLQWHNPHWVPQTSSPHRGLSTAALLILHIRQHRINPATGAGITCTYCATTALASCWILSGYVRYAILILRLWLEYTFVKSYTNTLVISNIVFSMQTYTVTII